MAALGRIRPKDGTIDVGADATRRVASLLVEEGQSVKKDEILAYLDNHEEMQAAAAFAEAQYEGGKAQLTYRTVLNRPISPRPRRSSGPSRNSRRWKLPFRN